MAIVHDVLLLGLQFNFVNCAKAVQNQRSGPTDFQDEKPFASQQPTREALHPAPMATQPTTRISPTPRCSITRQARSWRRASRVCSHSTPYPASAAAASAIGHTQRNGLCDWLMNGRP